jgi:hypothetical protein
MNEKLIYIEVISTKNLKNQTESILKSLCIKDNIEYFCERINIDNKKCLLKSNNLESLYEFFGQEYEAEDPRLFLYENEIYIIFNIKNQNGRSVCISPYKKFVPIKLFIEGEKMNEIEKNWSPFVKDKKLFFVYCYHPLIIISYDFNEEGRCHVVYKPNNINLPLEPFWKITIRGSTNLLPYKEQYYIGLVHSTIWADRLNIGSCSYPYYCPFLILLDTKKWSIVYISKPLILECDDINIKIDKKDNYIFEENDWHCVNYPTSINNIRENEYIVTFNINQNNCLKYKLIIDQIEIENEERDWNELVRYESIKTIKTFTKYKNDTYF